MLHHFCIAQVFLQHYSNVRDNSKISRNALFYSQTWLQHRESIVSSVHFKIEELGNSKRLSTIAEVLLQRLGSKSKPGGRKPLTAQAERQLENTAKGSTELGGMRLSCRQRLKQYIPDNSYQASHCLFLLYLP